MEIKSVKLSVFLTGTSARAFLIQKISMSGQNEKPIKIQPREFLMKRRAIPPDRRVNDKA